MTPELTAAAYVLGGFLLLFALLFLTACAGLNAHDKQRPPWFNRGP